MVDIILGIKGTLAEASAEALQIFGKGGLDVSQLDHTPKDENFLGYGNTPLQEDINGMQYCVARVDDYFVQPLIDIGETNTAWFVQVWERGEPTMVDYTVEVAVYDEETGEKIGTQPEVRTKAVYPPVFEIEVYDYDMDGKQVGTKMVEIASIA